MRRRLVPAAIVIVVMTLSACGGSGGSDPKGSGSGEARPTGEVELLVPCDAVSAEEVGEILGGAFTSETGPFDACEFDQDDPRATSFALDAQSVSALGGGFEVYRSGSKGAFTDAEQIDLPDIGDDGFITTGRFGDGTNIQLQAAVLVDGQVLTVSLTQASGVAKDELINQATRLMTLVASKT